jgi:hypothetical protein
MDLLRHSFFRRKKQQEQRPDLCLVGWLVTPLLAEHGLQNRTLKNWDWSREKEERESGQEREKPGQERETSPGK